MTGAYMRVNRNGKVVNVPLEELTSQERYDLLIHRDTEELLRWIDLLCDSLVESDNYIKELEG